MAAVPSSFSPLSKEEFEKKFHRSLHEQFIVGLEKNKDTFEYCATEHLKMSGVYWALMSLDLMGSLHLMSRDSIISWVLLCQHENGGFGGNIGHDPHLLYTLSAVQILLILDADEHIKTEAITKYVSELQQPDGSFIGDQWGEVDTRFSYCALNCLALLHQLHRIDIKKATLFVGRCRNFDGGFGSVPGAESHAGQIFVCVASLVIGDCLSDYCDIGVLGWWLAERQLMSSGGLNGRPEKKADVCYSWWVLSSLAMLQHLNWIDGNSLANFIFNCQDAEEGGIADRPQNISDPFHTYFGIAALSLLGYQPLNHIDPVYALPTRCIQRLNIGKTYEQRG